MIIEHSARFRVELASDPDMVRAAQRLRYDVFVGELGATGTTVDHEQRLEWDRFDAYCDHLLLMDTRAGEVAGVYRVMTEARAAAAGSFYSETEFDLSALRRSGRRMLELGRSCLAPRYRGTAALHHLWAGLDAYIRDHDIQLMFGVASFHGTDVSGLSASLSLLHHVYRAPDALRPVARAPGAVAMDVLAADAVCRRSAMVQMPALIKSYLRLGGLVGEGAFVDRAFNTTDVCLVLDAARVGAWRAPRG